MSRKLLIICAIILVLAFIVGIYEAYKNSSSTPNTGTQKSLLGSLFPFGDTSTAPKTTDTTGGGSVTTPPTGDAPSGKPRRLTLVSNKVAAGDIFLLPPTTTVVPNFSVTGSTTANSASLPVIRFVEAGTGYIFDIKVDGTNVRKTSATVIARTAQAVFADNGNSVVLQYIKNDNQTVATFLGHVTPPATSTADGTLTGDFLPDNIVDIVASYDQKNFLFLLPSDVGVAGISMKSDGSGKKQLFSSSFSEWLIDWPATGPALTTKASANVPGYAYVVNGQGIFQKYIGSINGLTTKMSPDGKAVLYSISGGNGLDLHIKNLKTGADVNTGIQTLPEKCVWTADSTFAYCGGPSNIPAQPYPDMWYQGVAHFTDAFWRIAALTGTTTEVNDGEGDAIDATNLTLDSTGKYIGMINKTDGTLWSLDMTTTPPPPVTPTLPSVR